MKIKLYNNDCINVLRDLKSESIDLVLTDPPYGTTACRWDTCLNMSEIWLELNRIVKKSSPILLFGCEPFSSNLRMSNIEQFRYDIIWNKKKPSNFQMMNFQPGRIHEYIHVFSKLPAVYSKTGSMNYYPIKESIDPYLRKRSFYGSKNSTLREGHTIKELGVKIRDTKNKYYSIIEVSNANIKSKVHPTEKPIDLLDILIQTYSLEGDTVLDFTMGGGSCGVASVKNYRNFIGCELDTDYYDLAKKRISDANRVLF